MRSTPNQSKYTSNTEVVLFIGYRVQEIGNLTRLKKLKDLRFSDPHWGPSPLSLLHNYQVESSGEPSKAVKVNVETNYTSLCEL